MKVSYTRFYNSDMQRLEFLLVDYDYIDGNEKLAELFKTEYGYELIDSIDGIWFKTIRIATKDSFYELLWHEDTGNCIYCITQSEKENSLLEKRLQRVLKLLNDMLM